MNMLLSIVTLFANLTLTPSVITPPKVPLINVATVLSIYDGDTITVLQNGQKVNVRLACLDAPELKQTPQGVNSRDAISKLIPIGSSIEYIVIGKDRYGRSVSKVYNNYLFVNLEMVLQGQAFIHPKYFKPCIDQKQSFMYAEERSKEAKLGIWDTDIAKPWDFRGKK